MRPKGKDFLKKQAFRKHIRRKDSRRIQYSAAVRKNILKSLERGTCERRKDTAKNQNCKTDSGTDALEIEFVVKLVFKRVAKGKDQAECEEERAGKPKSNSKDDQQLPHMHSPFNVDKAAEN